MLFLVLATIQATAQAGRRRGFNVWENLGEYLKLWHWPRATKFVASHADVLNDQRVLSDKKAELIKCSASDGLSLLPVIAVYILTCIMQSDLEGCKAACKVLIAFGDVIELLQATALNIVTPEQLRSAVKSLIVHCIAAGWEEHMVPKFHWMLHYAKHLARWGVLPTCWVHERKHKALKRFAADIHNSLSYSKSVLSEMICHQLWEMKQENAFGWPGLVEPRNAPRTICEFINATLGISDERVLTSSQAIVPSGARCSASDVVIIKSEDGVNYVAGQVRCFVSVASAGSLALVDMWLLDRTDPDSGCVIWNTASMNPTLLDLAFLLAPCIWTNVGGAQARTIIPYQFRGLQAQAA